jgi:hypothetical protein
MLSGLITICGGLLAASAFIIARKPNASQLIEKITPYQGWIGLLMFGWGVRELVYLVPNLGNFSAAPLFMTFWLLVAVADLAVGFLLGFGLITKYALSRSPAAEARGKYLRSRLISYQVPMGVLAMVMGMLYIALPYIV